MRFQVISSTVSYSHPITSPKGRVTLSFSVFPCRHGELKFSDGNRLVARDLSEKWGEPLTVSDLYGKSLYGDPDVLEDGGKWPVSTNITVSTEDRKEVNFLKDEEFSCGYAIYSPDRGLSIWLSVSTDVFNDLLQVRSDLPALMFFDIKIRGLADMGYDYDPKWLHGTWDLEDKSDCGSGECRVVTDFTVEREAPFFPRNLQIERLDAERLENKKVIDQFRSLLAELVAIEKGAVDGATTTLLRLILLAVSAIVVIGILALVMLYF